MAVRAGGPRAGGAAAGGAGVVLVVVLAFLSLSAYLGVHKVDEGHVGMYWRGGALLNSVTDPGFHTMIPFITSTANVQTTIQTDEVKNIPCGTSGGVLIYFDKIEVVNRLRKDHALSTIKQYGLNYDKLWIFDKIHHEINQFCSKHSLQEVYIDMFDMLDEALQNALQESCNKWDTGIEIVNIRVTKPKIPEAIAHAYLSVNEEKTKLLVAQQHQLLVAKEEETKRLTALVAAQREAEVSKVNAEKEAAVAIIAQQRETNVSLIRLEKEVKEKENEAKKQAIETQMNIEKAKAQAMSEATVSAVRSEMHLKAKENEARMAAIETQMLVDRQKAVADANAYAIVKEGEALKSKLSPEFLRLSLYQSLANNTKIYFGSSIPNIFVDWADSGLLTKKP